MLVIRLNQLYWKLRLLYFFFKLYAFILLTSTLVPGINYGVIREIRDT